jgi:LmbE family N-acetylglucosaminyl deacetylase
MTRTALALSPHLDDAVFSCGGTLALLARQGWRVVIATLFTRSVPDPKGFALACQLDKGLDAAIDYMALRRAEDVEAASRLRLAPPIHVPLPEAPHRGYQSAAALFGAIGSEDTVAVALGDAIRRLVDAQTPDLILAPQAIGGHIDHVQVVRAMPDLDVPVLWWRDFPYVVRAGTPAEPFRDRMDVLPTESVRLDERASAAKEEACLAYASQLGFQFGGPDGLRQLLRQAAAVEHFRGRGPDQCLLPLREKVPAGG